MLLWDWGRDVDSLLIMLPSLQQSTSYIYIYIYLSKISQIVKSDVTILPYDHLTDLLLYGSKAFNDITNELILTETILFIYKSQRFKVLEAFAWFSPFQLHDTSHLGHGAGPCELHVHLLFVSVYVLVFFFSLVSVWWGPGGVQQDACTHHTTIKLYIAFYLFSNYTKKKGLGF